MGDERLRAAAIQLFRRYQEVFVEGYGICPWASAARREERVREVVLCDREPSLSSTLATVEALAADEQVEIGIVIYPRVTLERAAFAQFVAEVRAADAEARGGSVPFAMAEFHPESAAVLTPSGAFVSFLRRTPDPVIQLVRRTSLDRVRAGESHGSGYLDPKLLDKFMAQALEPVRPLLHDRLEEHNRATVKSVGLARVAELLDRLRAERDAVYRALEGE